MEYALETLKYLSGYPVTIKEQAALLIKQNRLGAMLLRRYPDVHEYRNDKALYQYAQAIKSQYLRNSPALNKVCYDSKIQVIKHALGLHHSVNRVQGNKLKTKTEIQIATLFKDAPEAFLRMIVVHELAHLKEKMHDKAFYSLCCYMEPQYHQLELDTRLYLTHLDLFGQLYK
jgi:predicted metal-dependent hydrolase